jgi:hypothetical protein
MPDTKTTDRTTVMVDAKIKDWDADVPERAARLEKLLNRSIVEAVPRESAKCPPGVVLLYLCPFTNPGPGLARLIVLHHRLDWQRVVEKLQAQGRVTKVEGGGIGRVE